ncbi:MAG: heme lyase CcmF/NrfE family subunit [Gammaproteobacteria bacterium AqS3]|nr:heme lyase CcmF/NrfE family subunit [Gammaproteobacteria bacterium AqS3]
MLAETGHLTLALWCAASAALAVLPWLWRSADAPAAQPLLRTLAVLQLGLIATSFALLVTAFVQLDFSVELVLQHAHVDLPALYRITATWGNHEGSMLMWLLQLGLWSAALALLPSRMDEVLRRSALGCMGVLNTGFGLFSLITSNPFERHLPFTELQGADLNPLLQDLAMAAHPPMLYAGYVGFAAVFAIACGGLISGRIDRTWAAALRPWANVAWALLGVGIALGSWWAYYELGWGGWWFWDPVENASLMPWLAGAALLHSLAVMQRSGHFQHWSVLLAILTFSMSMMGTFLVRSGVLTSVHTFANDPARGLFLLGLMLFFASVALLLYGRLVQRQTASAPITDFTLHARLSALLVNNFTLIGLLGIVLLGTLFPLATQVLDVGHYSVGENYFNTLSAPVAGVMLLACGWGALTSWRGEPIPWRSWAPPAGAGVLLALGVGVIWGWHPLGLGAGALSGWILGSLWRPAGGVQWGMRLAHFGLAAGALGIGVTGAHSVEREVVMGPGDILDLGPVRVEFVGESVVEGPNYRANQVLFSLYRGGSEAGRNLTAQKRFYPVRGQWMTEAGIAAGFWADSYVALGERRENGAWAVRVQHKPLIRWIWFGVGLMGLGAFVGALSRRSRRAGVGAVAESPAT